MNKDFIKLIFKILLYIITALAGFFGVSSLASCASSASVQICGKTQVVSVDTTIIHHDGFIRSKNYKSY
jgi:hypothetical protein